MNSDVSGSELFEVQLSVLLVAHIPPDKVEVIVDTLINKRAALDGVSKTWAAQVRNFRNCGSDAGLTFLNFERMERKS